MFKLILKYGADVKTDFISLIYPEIEMHHNPSVEIGHVLKCDLVFSRSQPPLSQMMGATVL